MIARFASSHSPKCARGSGRDFPIEVPEQFIQGHHDFVSRTDTCAGRCAYQRIRMTQKRQRDVGWKYDTELRRHSCRHGQCRTLNDPLAKLATALAGLVVGLLFIGWA